MIDEQIESPKIDYSLRNLGEQSLGDWLKWVKRFY
jgi:hypothetical protein